jgi:hypothetical protein
MSSTPDPPSDHYCIICLDHSCHTTRLKLCVNRNCTCRIHLTCYYRWWYRDTYTGTCICGYWIDPRRFGLPMWVVRTPYFNSESSTETDLETETTTHQCPNCAKITGRRGCINWDKYIYLSRYYWCWFWSISYLGKLVGYLIHNHMVWGFWTRYGIGFQFYGFIIGSVCLGLCLLLATVGKVVVSNWQISDS